MSKIILFKDKLKEYAEINIPGSKSESNRALIINALCDNPGDIDNLATARDTTTMRHCLESRQKVYDVLDAGTVMRFLTAYLAISQNDVEITGTARMQKRPIKILVDALSQIGASITYLGQEGFPPLKFNGFDKQFTRDLTVAGDTSSQYISALLMIAPRLPHGLTLSLAGGTVSKPYIDMTLALMQHFGVEIQTSQHGYEIEPQHYTFKPFRVESDWSAVSYWYSLFRLSNLKALKLPGYRATSFQGDSVVAKMMQGFGVHTEFAADGIVLSRSEQQLPDRLDFVDCPDLAQTFAVLCAALGHSCNFTGLQTLKIKETDRILALQKELGKFGAQLLEKEDYWHLLPGKQGVKTYQHLEFATYEDHRMAMALAPLAVLCKVSFDDQTVVDKSYPSFWQDLAKIGLKVEA
jgi:3-phosphoshikimate 1-carboxyvinyltransferase